MNLNPVAGVALRRRRLVGTFVGNGMAAEQRRYLDHGRAGTARGERPSAKRSNLAHSNPFAKAAPASRSIAIPPSVHAAPNSKMTLSAEQQAHVVRRELLSRYEEELIWGEIPQVSSEENWLVRHFQSLRNDARYRYSKGMVMVSGKDMIRELGERGFDPEYLIVAEGKRIPEWAKNTTQIVRASAEAMDAMAPGTDGYVGNFEMPEASLNEELIANQRQLKRVAVFDNIDDPGTLGSMMRTAAALAFDAVILTNHCADMYDHRVVAAARGVHFQKATKFFSLREQDGDNAFALLNHVIERNNLDPVLFSQPSESRTSSVVPPSALNPSTSGKFDGPPPPAWLRDSLQQLKAKPSARPDPTEGVKEPRTSRLVPTTTARAAVSSEASEAPRGSSSLMEGDSTADSLRRRTLHDYCTSFHLEGSVPPAKSTAETGEVLHPGIMLVAGPDHLQTLPQRVGPQLRRRPTVLQLDGPVHHQPLVSAFPSARTTSELSPRSFAMTLPMVMFQLRESAQWDYMTPRTPEETEAARRAAHEAQLRNRYVDIGPDRSAPISEPNETEEQFKRRIRAERRQKRADRMQRRLATDPERWEDLQLRRMAAQHTAALERRRNPLKTVRVPDIKADPRYPDHIDELLQGSTDRESMREVADWAQHYSPPPNYDARFKPSEPRTRRNRVVPVV